MYDALRPHEKRFCTVKPTWYYEKRLMLAFAPTNNALIVVIDSELTLRPHHAITTEKRRTNREPTTITSMDCPTESPCAK